MRNQTSTTQSNQNDDFGKRYQAELQRKFVDLQFKRSELEEQLKQINDILFSLGREMEQGLAYDHLYKWCLELGDIANGLIEFVQAFLFLGITPT